jgi:hypothetical protein
MSVALLLALAPLAGGELKIPVATYEQKVYASWLGQCVGNVYGIPHENKYIEDAGPDAFPYGYTTSVDRMKEAGGVFSDDDTDFEYMYLLAMERYGPEPTYAQMATTWLHHVHDRVWLANRAALALMHVGYTPPATGQRETNPHWFQIDPQLVNEIWAVTAPGMVRYAAEKSEWAARITSDDFGVEPTVHYGAMYAAAFFESDVAKLVDIATAALPPGSRFAATVEDMKALFRQYPDDWRKARAEMAAKYYVNEPLETKTIWNANLNGAAGILALLYGGGDFQKTLDLACAMGFDADNQAATMAGLVALARGKDAIPREQLFPFPELGWTEPLNDFYKNQTREDMADASIRDLARRMARQGEAIVLAHGGRRVVEDGVAYLVIDTSAHFTPPLELPAGPTPRLEKGAPVRFAVPVSAGVGSVEWRVAAGALPPGVSLADGELRGTPGAIGVFDATLAVRQGSREATREFRFVVRPENLAPAAHRVLACVPKTNVAKRDAMWLTLAHSTYADDVAVIRDGRRDGERQTFYSIGDSDAPRKDYYGYEWASPQTIGLLSYHSGAVEESGGWFTSLDVEYRGADGAWTSVRDLAVSPPVTGGEQPFDKPHFVERLLSFRPVTTTAIRLIGEAGHTRHWRSKRTPFTSITELGVYGPVPGLPGDD